MALISDDNFAVAVVVAVVQLITIFLLPQELSGLRIFLSFSLLLT